MTLGIGITQNDGRVLLAGDKRLTKHGQVFSDKSKKVNTFEVRDVVIGVVTSGDANAQQLYPKVFHDIFLKNRTKLIVDSNESQLMLINIVRKAFFEHDVVKNSVITKSSDNHVHEGYFLVSFLGRLYYFDNVTVSDATDDEFFTIGCGRTYADGIIEYAFETLNALELDHLFNAVAKFDNGVSVCYDAVIIPNKAGEKEEIL